MSLIVKSIVNVSEAQTILIILSEYITLLLRLEVRVLKLVPQTIFFVVLRLRILEAWFTIFELRLSNESPLFELVALIFQFSLDGLSAKTGKEIHAQFDEYLIERMIFFLHFLMMAAALLCLPSLNKICHTFEYFISSSEILVNKMFIMQLQKPMIQFILLWSPVTLLDIFCLLLSHLYLRIHISLLRLLFVFLSGQSNMTLLSK